MQGALNETTQMLSLTTTPAKAMRPEAGCRRCGGLLVRDHCLDLLDSTGHLEFPALRCVQCGDIIDPVILKHRSGHISVTVGREAHSSSRVQAAGGHRA